MKKAETREAFEIERRVMSYCDDVRKGRRVAGELERLAVSRFLDDVASSKKKASTFSFSWEEPDRVRRFAEELKQSKGEFAGKKLQLSGWQCFAIANIYGFTLSGHPNKKRFREFYLRVARKNGKTTMTCPMMLYNLLTEPGAEIYTAGTTEFQARISWNESRSMVKKDKILSDRVECFKNALVFNDGHMIPVSSEYDRLDGLNVSFAYIDEYAQHPTDDMVTVLTTGMGARENPLLVITTTAGASNVSPCFLEDERIQKILRGIIRDDTTFAMIFQPDATDDWSSMAAIRKANPNMGIAIREEYLLEQVAQAKERPAQTNAIKNKNLNLWTSSSTAWITDDKWCTRVMKPFEDSELEGLPCVLAFDLSKIDDFTALTALFKKDGVYFQRHRFYIPEGSIHRKMKTDAPLIEKWIKDGFIVAIPGETIDESYIKSDIIKLSTQHAVRMIAYDPYLSSKVVETLVSSLPCMPIEQSLRHLSEPTKAWEKTVYEGRLRDPNPVLRWMLSCTTIKPDINNNYKPIKPDANKTSKRIDGVVSSVMAFAVRDYLDAVNDEGMSFESVLALIG